jgi:uroporphyrin-III C-methyltransferase
MKHGTVYLVGAGPGDPDLLTVKAHRLLKSADVVVVDRLVSAQITSLIPRGTPRIFAGKSCHHHVMSQEEINELLVALALKGRNVVRLKGGDPLLFGRGGEEAEHLAAHNIAFEIVPGVTSANACAAYAGIPLTHRGLATGVRYLTGHRANKENAEQPLALDWPSLTDPDTTLVIYMGLANLAVISRELIAAGLDAQTPAAAIQEGTTEKQRIVIGSLRDLPAQVEKAKLEAPVLVIIGRVVRLADKLAWFAPASMPSASRSRKATRR